MLAASSVVLLSTATRVGLRSSIRSSDPTIRDPPSAPIYQYATYDEQVGITFAQNYTSLSFNVTAVAQSESSTGVGPAYLLNGLTDTGYWYQVGLSYRWPDNTGSPLPGFNMSYEVFTPVPCNSPSGCCNGSIFPTTCGAGIANLAVGPGDTVRLSLGFSGGNVTMQAKDLKTGSAHNESFSAEGGTQFVGLANQPADTNGFFTGLMTEQYHGTVYYGSGEPVHYRQNGSTVPAATMWADEFNTNPLRPIFSEHTPASITLNDTSLLKYFSTNGTAEAGNSTELITGLAPIAFPTLASSISTSYRPGQQASIRLTITDPSLLTIRITSLDVTTQFGTFDITKSAPSDFTGNSSLTARVLIPSATLNGTYTVTITGAFQFLDSQTAGWFDAQPMYSSTSLTVSGRPITQPITPTLSQLALAVGGVFLPMILGLMAAGIVGAAAALVVTRRERLASSDILWGPRYCSACGGVAEHNMSFCPLCGASLTAPVQSPSPSASIEPPRLPDS